MTVEENKKAMKRLRSLGVGGYVVMTQEAGKANLSTRFPIGQIVALSETWTVVVRKLGQRSKGGYSAVFWEPAPNRLINYLNDTDVRPSRRTR